MSGDTHEKVSRAINFGDDEIDLVEPSDAANHSSSPPPPSEQETSPRNPVQCFSDQRDCDVEDVLQRTIDSVVSNVQQAARVDLQSDATSAATSFNEVCSSNENPKPQTSDVFSHAKDDGPELEFFQSAASLANVDIGSDDDDFGDFGDFSKPQASSVVTNGDLTAAHDDDEADEDEEEEEEEEDDDDFGDFEEAAGGPPSDGFARFDDPTLNPSGGFVEDSVAPVSRESFRNLIAKLFAVVDHSSSSSTGNDLVDRPVETGHFHASVHRDMTRCEDVDNWPCVLFRYDGSRTRKTLLTALCIDETPANCPRFAIDCLSNEFLQPVKESRGGNSAVGRPSAAGDGRELSEKAKEVLNKIPDLSFMKAEVLTFPAAVQAP